jgi:hypothetical protein
MTNDAQQTARPSKRIREQLKNLLLVLAGAVTFAFLMRILANVIVGYLALHAFSLRLFLAAGFGEIGHPQSGEQHRD